MKTFIYILFSIPLLSFSQLHAQGNKDLNVAVVQSIFEAFNEHNWKKMLSHYSEEAVFVDPAFDAPVSDRKVIKAHYEEILQYFPDVKDEIVTITASGDRVVVEFVSSGTSKNGDKFRLPICTVFTIQKGKVSRDVTYYDRTH